jgi:hypothetical protein
MANVRIDDADWSTRSVFLGQRARLQVAVGSCFHQSGHVVNTFTTLAEVDVLQYFCGVGSSVPSYVHLQQGIEPSNWGSKVEVRDGANISDGDMSGTLVRLQPHLLFQPAVAARRSSNRSRPRSVREGDSGVQTMHWYLLGGPSCQERRERSASQKGAAGLVTAASESVVAFCSCLHLHPFGRAACPFRGVLGAATV